jgi:soluble P-type ATPase
MFKLDMPGFGLLELEHIVLDYTGTLSFNGALLPNVKEKLNELAKILSIHVLTADTFGTAIDELAEIFCEIRIITGGNLDVQKEEYAKSLGAEKVVAIGNGLNDRRMLKIARLAISVTGREGCAVETLLAADIQIMDIVDALDLMLNPKRLKATLIF